MLINELNPNAVEHLKKFEVMLENKEPFSFVRFSDGEIEVLRNRYLEIDSGKTVFRGRVFNNNFPTFDSKKFDPLSQQDIRKDLLSASLFRDENFYKGIPTKHNNAIKDREFLLRLNGGFDVNMTFSDLFLNSNYLNYRKKIVPLFEKFENICVIANYRAKPISYVKNAKHIKVPDNFFLEYEATLQDVLNETLVLKENTLILSSASSLSNIIGHKLFLERKDITFLDIGTSINDLLSLNHSTRAYHNEEKSLLNKLFYRKSKGYQIEW